MQNYERRKFRRGPEKDSSTGLEVSGDSVLGEILQANAVMMPWAICPHGGFGPILKNFLFHHDPFIHQVFDHSRPNATIMYSKATSHPTPVGILQTANAVWSRTADRRFFGHSYTAPTPIEHTLQQLGLGLTKAFALHHKLALRKQGARPSHVPPAPPGFSSVDDVDSDTAWGATSSLSNPVILV